MSFERPPSPREKPPSLTSEQLRLYTNKLIEMMEVDETTRRKLTTMPSQSDTHAYQAYVRGRSAWWEESFGFSFSNLARRTEIIVKAFAEDFGGAKVAETPAPVVEKPAPMEEIVLVEPEVNEEPTIERASLKNEQDFLAHVDSKLEDIRRNVHVGSFVVEVSNGARPDAAAQLQRLMYEAYQWDSVEAVARIRAMYEERYVAQREHVKLLCDFGEAIKKQGRENPRTSSGGGEVVLELCKVMNRTADFVDQHESNPQLLKAFWETTMAWSHAMRQNVEAKRMRSGVLTSVAAVKICRALNMPTRSATVEEDVYYGIDLWLDPTSAVQIKGNTQGHNVLTRVTVTAPARYVSHPRGQYEHSFVNAVAGQRDFGARVGLYEKKREKKFDAYWLEIGNRWFDLVTGVPRAGLIPWAQEAFAKVYRNMPKPRPVAAPAIVGKPQVVEVKRIAPAPVAKLMIVERDAPNQPTGKKPTKYEQFLANRPKPREVALAHIPVTAYSAVRNFLMINHNRFTTAIGATIEQFLAGTELTPVAESILIDQMANVAELIDPTVTRATVIAWIAEQYPDDSVEERQIAGYADLASLSLIHESRPQVLQVTPQAIRAFYSAYPHVFTVPEKKILDRFGTLTTVGPYELRQAKNIIHSQIAKRFSPIPANFDAIATRMLSEEYGSRPPSPPRAP